MYEKILVPLDGSELSEIAVPYAEELAERLGSEITFLYVDEVATGPHHPLHQFYQGGGERYIEKPDAKEIKVVPRMLVGHPAERIVEYAGEEDVSLIVMATHGRSGVRRWALGSVADKVVEAVKSGAIKHFFLVAGCDGAKPGRNYYTDFVEKVPKDCVVLTLACGKFRFFDKDLGDIGDIPRLLDIGQCNDAYSAIQIAVALSKAFNVGVNELPLSMILSWYEQKACAILLTLLHLGIKDIRLGPSLPAFITPNVLDVLVKNFNIKAISTPDEDLKAIMGEAA